MRNLKLFHFPILYPCISIPLWLKTGENAEHIKLRTFILSHWLRTCCTLAVALKGDEKAHTTLSGMIIRSDKKVWQSVIKTCAESTLATAELSTLSPSTSDSAASHLE